MRDGLRIHLGNEKQSKTSKSFRKFCRLKKQKKKKPGIIALPVQEDDASCNQDFKKLEETKLEEDPKDRRETLQSQRKVRKLHKIKRTNKEAFQITSHYPQLQLNNVRYTQESWKRCNPILSEVEEDARLNKIAFSSSTSEVAAVVRSFELSYRR